MRLLCLILPLALGACVEESAPTANDGGNTVPIETSCGATELQYLVGQSAKALETMRFGHTVRIIQPGMAVTTDHMPDRLNIWVDQTNLITRISCG